MSGDLSKLRESLRSYPEWIREETEGLTLEEMCFAAQEPAWARWSIDLQIRHVAVAPCAWLYLRGGDVLRAAGYKFPADAEAIAALRKKEGRHVPPEVAPHREAVLDIIREWAAFGCAIIDREGPEGLRRIKFTRYTDPAEHRPRDPRPTIEYNRTAARLHPDGFTEDPGRPGHFTVEIGAALRHVYWDGLAHTRTIQRIKGLLGRPPKVALPREGYLTLPEFYD